MPYERALASDRLGRLFAPGHPGRRAALETAAAIYDSIGAAPDAARARFLADDAISRPVH